MSDLEIIKELEKEIKTFLIKDQKREKNNSFSVDEEKNVIYINIQKDSISIIPKNLFKFKSIKGLDISHNNISDHTPLTEIKTLEFLSVDLLGNEPSSVIENILNKLKNLKALNLFGNKYNWLILKREALNNKFQFSLNPIPFGGKGIYIEKQLSYPPTPMIKLGYNNLKFFYENYISEGLEKEVRFDREKKLSMAKFKQLFIKETLSNYYSSFKSRVELRYSIHNIQICNYQGIRHLTINDIAKKDITKNKVDPRWIFLTGENGFGKTSILQAIVIGLFGMVENDRILAKDAIIDIEFKNSLDYCINSIEKGSDSFIPFENFAAYGPARLNKSQRPLNENKTYSLFNTDGVLFDIEEKLMTWEKAPNQEKYYKSARKILLNLLSPQIEDIIIIREGTKTGVKYFECKEKKHKPFNELASGYRTIIAMIGDIIIRLSENQPEINDFRDLSGIVIIDEIDLHLHPKWQKALVEKLTETFPKIQFIASTHSPIPLLGAPANSIIINVQRSEEKGITAEKLDIDFSTLTPNSILSSPIFGFEDLIPTSKSNDDFLNTEDSYKDIEAKTERRKQIAKYLSPEKTDEFLKLLNDNGQ